MKHTLIISTVLLVLTSCNQDNNANDGNNKNVTTDTSALSEQNHQPKRLSFRNITGIFADSSYSIWVDKQYSSFSLALHFQEEDTLEVSYSPECWLVFPYKQDTNRLIVYWDNNIDTKYNFDVVKAINKIDKKIIGRPFMV
jgi:hypothetical protein